LSKEEHAAYYLPLYMEPAMCVFSSSSFAQAGFNL